MEETDLSIRHDDLLTRYTSDRIARHQTMPDGVRLIAANQLTIDIRFLDPHLVRVSYHVPDMPPPPLSYATTSGTEPFSAPEVVVRQSAKHIAASGGPLNVVVEKESGKVRMENAEGGVLQDDRDGFLGIHSMCRGVTRVEIDRRMGPDEYYFGLGDKAGQLQLRGQKFENWNTDAYAYGIGSDPLYRSIPFYCGLSEAGAWGMFIDNSYRTTFDFGTEEADSLRISAAGGEMVYYFIFGEDLCAVARRYALLTGLPDLPPIWALGYHQCRWSYFPDDRVREVASQFRALSIPCDAIYLDIDYMDEYRCFTWDQERFPDPAGLVSELRADGFRTVVMIDPGIKQESGYSIYKDGLEKDVFCRRPDGSLMVGPVWPGPCVFPDYTNPEVRQWWGRLYRQLYLETGISGFWNDMNEPAVFRLSSMTFPDDVMHHFEGQPVHHARVHNVYGMQMTRATTEGLLALDPERRPFVLTRASFSGGQRYAAVWTGDNISTWEHLAIANRQCQRLSISGFSFCGSDIGGFVDRPEPELFVRWVQLGAFHPLFRTHSMGNHASGAEAVDEESLLTAQADDRMDQEPWAFGEPWTAYAKAAIELRYQLLGYLYSAFREYVTSGQPILTPLSFFDSADPDCLLREREFLCGPDLLVSPVLNPGERQQAVYFPRGRWYDFHTGAAVSGQGFKRVEAPIEAIPLYIRAGAVLPLWPVRQHTAEPAEELTLRICYAKGSQQSAWYEDAGEGFAYQKGGCLENRMTQTGYSGAVELSWHRKGVWKSNWKRIRLQFVGLPFQPRRLRIDGKYVLIEETATGWEALLETGVFSRCLIE